MWITYHGYGINSFFFFFFYTLGLLLHKDPAHPRPFTSPQDKVKAACNATEAPDLHWSLATADARGGCSPWGHQPCLSLLFPGGGPAACWGSPSVLDGRAKRRLGACAHRPPPGPEAPASLQQGQGEAVQAQHVGAGSPNRSRLVGVGSPSKDHQGHGVPGARKSKYRFRVRVKHHGGCVPLSSAPRDHPGAPRRKVQAPCHVTSPVTAPSSLSDPARPLPAEPQPSPEAPAHLTPRHTEPAHIHSRPCHPSLHRAPPS